MWISVVEKATDGKTDRVALAHEQHILPSLELSFSKVEHTVRLLEDGETVKRYRVHLSGGSWDYTFRYYTVSHAPTHL